MDSITILGLVAGTLTTIGFLPQVIKSWRTKKTTDVSLLMPTLLAIGISLWLIYGILLNDFPIIIANAISLVFNMIQILLVIRYSRKSA